jgi:hypothetical protein
MAAKVVLFLIRKRLNNYEGNFSFWFFVSSSPCGNKKVTKTLWHKVSQGMYYSFKNFDLPKFKPSIFVKFTKYTPVGKVEIST